MAVCRNHLSGHRPRGEERPPAATVHRVTSDHHQAGDPAPGDLPGDGGDPGPLHLHLLLTFPTRGQCRPLAARPRGCSFPSLATPPPAAAAEARLLFVANDLDTAEPSSGPGLQPSTAQLSHLAEAACRIVWAEEQSTQYLHSIYTVSTQYLHSIYTVSTPDTCQYQAS